MKPLNILVFAYNRPLHLERCLQAINDNSLAGQANITICIDGYKESATAKEREIHQQTIAVANKKRLANSSVIVNETNLGLSTQYFSKIELLLEKYKNLIIVEDDIIVGKFFLEYMHTALTKYGDSPQISMILGYVYSIALLGKNNDSFFGRTSGNKAFGISREFWSHIDKECIGWEQLKYDKKLRRKYNTPGVDSAAMLISELEDNQNKSWDSIVHWNCFIKNLLVLCPDQTLAIDDGWGNEGTNTFGENLVDIKVFDSNYRITKYPEYIKQDQIKRFLVFVYFAYILRFKFLFKRIRTKLNLT